MKKAINRKFSKVLFFGSDEFSLALLIKLKEISSSHPSLINEMLVVTQGRESNISSRKTNPIEIYCSQNNLECQIPIKSLSTAKEEWNVFSDDIRSFDIGIIASYGLMIPKSIIGLCRKDFVVFHPSDLPKYRGAAPIQHAILNKEKETAISVARVSPSKFDAGEILFKEKINIDETDTFFTLREKISQKATNLLLPFLIDSMEEKLEGEIQNEALVTKAPKLLLEDTFLNFMKDDSNEIFQKYKAFLGSSLSSVRVNFQNSVLLLQEIELLSQSENEYLSSNFPNAISGSIWIVKAKSMKNFLFLKTLDKWLKVSKLVVQSKPEFSSLQFINKYLNREGYTSKSDLPFVYKFD